MVRGIEGVKKVYNEILVIKPLDKDKGAVEKKYSVDDTVSETRINALLPDGYCVNVTKSRYRSVNGHVFLFGRALAAQEKARPRQLSGASKTSVFWLKREPRNSSELL